MSCVCFCCTHIVCTSRSFALRPGNCLCDFAREIELSVQISSCCVSRGTRSSRFSSRKFLPPSLSVTAFASASADLNEIGCVTLQCFNGSYLIFSTPPQIEHLDFGHPARSLSTTTFNTLSFSHHLKLSLHVGRSSTYPVILLFCLQTSQRRIRPFSRKYESKCQIAFRSTNGKHLSWNHVHLSSASSAASLRPDSCQTCPALTARVRLPPQSAVHMCTIKLPV